MLLYHKKCILSFLIERRADLVYTITDIFEERIRMAEQKTNVMRVLEQKGIPYTAHCYAHGDTPIDGVTVAALIG